MVSFKEFISKRLNEDIDPNFKKVALVPGSYTPPHKGHLEMIKFYAKRNQEVVIIISNSKNRVNALGRELSAETRKKIWEIYLKAAKLKNVSIVISDKQSPITAAYDLATQKYNKGYQIIFGQSDKDDDNRWKGMYPYCKRFMRGPGASVMLPPENTKAPVAFDGLSSDELRNNIKKPTVIKKFIPEEITNKATIEKLIKMMKG